VESGIVISCHTGGREPFHPEMIRDNNQIKHLPN